jgi:hypothetical protein
MIGLFGRLLHHGFPLAAGEEVLADGKDRRSFAQDVPHPHRRRDAVIILANGVSLGFLAVILYFKLREMLSAHRQAPA